MTTPYTRTLALKRAALLLERLSDLSYDGARASLSDLKAEARTILADYPTKFDLYRMSQQTGMLDPELATPAQISHNAAHDS